jgi:CRP-like cAMP-binding protein
MSGAAEMTKGLERPIDFRIFKDIDLPAMQFVPGEALLSKGTPGALMFIIQTGSAAIIIDGVTVETIGAGQIAGELALVDSGPRSAEVVAITSVSAVAIDERKFIQLVGKVPHFALLVMKTMARRIRAMNERIGK